jgi:hypothetical protein
MSDQTEPYRRARLSELAAQQSDNCQELEIRHGQLWTTSELSEEFEVQGFLAPYVIVRRKSDGRMGSLDPGSTLVLNMINRDATTGRFVQTDPQ